MARFGEMITPLRALIRANADRRYISKMINLTALAPDIQAAILDETLPDRVWLCST